MYIAPRNDMMAAGTMRASFIRSPMRPTGNRSATAARYGTSCVMPIWASVAPRFVAYRFVPKPPAAAIDQTNCSSAPSQPNSKSRRL